MPPTSRRCTLNRTYRERNSAVWCGTVQCTFSCSLLRRISPYTLFYYDNEVIIRCQNTRGWFTAYTPVYPQYTLEPIKNLGGGLGKIWRACAPWPQPKTATGALHYCVDGSIWHFKFIKVVQAHAVGILGTLLLRVYSGTLLPIFIEIGSYLTDKKQKNKLAQFFETRCTYRILQSSCNFLQCIQYLPKIIKICWH